MKPATIAIIVLGAVALMIVAGAILLSLNDKEIPEALLVTLGASVGGVAGILVEKPSPD